MSASGARRLLALLSLLCCVLLTVPAHADQIKVLFIANQATPFSARVRAEIEAMGFAIVSSDVLDEQGRSTARAAAYVLETPSSRRVELWLQRASGRLELSTVLESPERASPGDEAAETVRASEQLRAFFQPLQAREAPPAPPVPPPVPSPLASPAAPTAPAPVPRATAPSATAVQREPKHFFEELAVALPLEPGSLGIDAIVRGGGWVLPRWGVGGKLVVPLLSSTLHSGANSANVSMALAGVELSRIVVNARALRLVARAGLALAWLHATGEASAPYTNHSDSAFAALPSLSAQLELPVSERLRLSLGAELGLALPKLEVAFADEPVAVWARPLGLLSAGVSLDL